MSTSKWSPQQAISRPSYPHSEASRHTSMNGRSAHWPVNSVTGRGMGTVLLGLVADFAGRARAAAGSTSPRRSSRSLTSVAARRSGTASGAEQSSTGASASASGSRPCEPLTGAGSSGTTDMV